MKPVSSNQPVSSIHHSLDTRDTGLEALPSILLPKNEMQMSSFRKVLITVSTFIK